MAHGVNGRNGGWGLPAAVSRETSQRFAEPRTPRSGAPRLHRRRASRRRRVRPLGFTRPLLPHTATRLSLPRQPERPRPCIQPVRPVPGLPPTTSPFRRSTPACRRRPSSSAAVDSEPTRLARHGPAVVAVSVCASVEGRVSIGCTQAARSTRLSRAMSPPARLHTLPLPDTPTGSSLPRQSERRVLPPNPSDLLHAELFDPPPVRTDTYLTSPIAATDSEPTRFGCHGPAVVAVAVFTSVEGHPSIGEGKTGSPSPLSGPPRHRFT